MRFLLILLMLFVGLNKGYAQHDESIPVSALTAVPFIQIVPGAHGNMNAGAYTALPTNEPGGFFHNPAQAGNFARENNLAFQTYPAEVEYLPDSDINLSNTALSAGYNFENLDSRIPVSLGFGFMDTSLDMTQDYVGQDGTPRGTFSSTEKYSMIAVGVNVDLGLRLGLGYARKSIDSELVPAGTGAPEARAETTANDYGLLLSYPWTYGDLFSEISLGFTYQNIGDRVQYVGVGQPDPLPRKNTIGYAISIGYEGELYGLSNNIVTWDWSQQASDILIDSNRDYISPPGNIHVLDNLILGESDERIQIRRGSRLELYETLQLGWGEIKWRGNQDPVRTYGFSVRTGFAGRYLTNETDSEILQSLAENIELTYSLSTYNLFEDDGHPLTDTTFHGLAIHFTIPAI